MASHVTHRNEKNALLHMLESKSPVNEGLEFLLTHSVSNEVNDNCAVFRQAPATYHTTIPYHTIFCATIT